MIRPSSMALAVGPCFGGENARNRARAVLAGDHIHLAFAASQDEAALWLCANGPTVVLIDLSLKDGSPLAVADFCNYRRPETRVILMGGGNLFSDGSIFGYVGNAHALVSGETSGADLSAMIAFHSGAMEMAC